ncbi:hypothetical protein EWU23_03900 [Cytophagaceae bacterium 50C-KIRBA]|uniref:Outer membrane protein beta-barrel domain-containing protein n=1 Tax=Aquirufa beregesia TaxID=2516556 RepID=A0ABX0EU71_9BACT|nr:hypothetical protein [Aquirufa beregesia]NGZ43613.1 hypothetical protein [Aquirufa beregesia]
MKKSLLFLLFIFNTFLSSAQTGSIEVSSGGFSFIPAFTSREPNLILNAGTNPQRKLSGHIMYMVRLKSLTPTGIILISRYKLINKKFKAIAGLHLPAMQVSENYQVTSIFGQELTLSYPLTNNVLMGAFFLNGRGRNNDFKATFSSVHANYHKNKWNFLTQMYYLDLGDLTGVAETISYDINSHFQAKAFVNFTPKDQFFISTVGLKYSL